MTEEQERRVQASREAEAFAWMDEDRKWQHGPAVYLLLAVILLVSIVTIVAALMGLR